ncbi:MAG: hypothetical protein HY062_16330 [Bacteroidetes bacterium]|nr:hypothetical protein [Bacteroidota bacterium]
MKRIIIPALFFALISASCKKNYSCTCTTKLTQSGYLPYQTATVEQVPKNTSHKKATKICNNTAKQMQANTRLLFDNNTKVETSCSLQEK